MQIPTPLSKKQPYPIMIPSAQLVRAPYTPELTTSDVDYKSLFNELDNHQRFSAPIILRNIDGIYEVVYGWHLVSVFNLWAKDNPKTLLSAMVYDFNDMESVYVGCRVFSDHFNPHRFFFAQALARVKAKHGISDETLAAWLGSGFSRASVNNLLRLLKLVQLAQDRYIKGHFKNAVAKFLAGQAPSKQHEILNRLSNRPFIRVEDVCPTSKQGMPSEASSGLSQRSKDLIRFELQLSEAIGAPLTVLKKETGEYHINVAFFSAGELGNILEKITHDSNGIGKAKGELKIDFEDMTNLNLYFDHILNAEKN